MVQRHELYAFLLNAIDNAIAANNNLSDVIPSQFRDDSAEPRIVCRSIRSAEYSISEDGR